jgi:putative endonuclease
MSKYQYVYVLRSQKDGKFYVGYTINIQKRVKEHNSGKVRSTKERRPMKIIYGEGCINQKDTTRTEKYLKTAWGKRYIKGRLKHYLTG